MKTIPCGVALIRDERRFLIAQRKDGDSFGSFWEFPGGRREPGETFEECVAREVREEVGIEVAVLEKFMDVKRCYHENIVWLHFYLCSRISGEPRAVECQNVVWAELEELAAYRFPPANERVIKKLKDRFL